MGNGPGNIKEYIDAFYKYPTLQGGFAWEWANHGLETKDKQTNEDFMAYGGDFGEEVHDSTFVMDGLVNSDHTPNAGLIEYKKAIEPVQLLEATNTEATFINRYDFIGVEHLVCKYTITSESGEGESGELEVPSNIQPGQTFKVKLPQASGQKGETFVSISFVLRESTPYLDAGFEISTAQVQIQSATTISSLENSGKQIEVSISKNVLKITSEKSTWEFNTLHGSLTSWLQDSTQLISKAPELDIFRAATDNDAPQDGWDWDDKKLHLAKTSVRKVSWSQSSTEEFVVTVNLRLAPPILSWSIEAVLNYHFHANGSLTVKVKGTPKGENLPRTLPRIGLVMELPSKFQSVEWFGRGPGESYRDSKLSQPIGKHTASSVNDLWVDYEVPQESSNRTDTRWVSVGNGSKALFAQFVEKGERRVFDFQASHYRMRDVAKAKHPYELRKLKREEVVLRLDSEHHGLGSGSCGPRTLDEYACLTKEFEFEVLLQGR